MGCPQDALGMAVMTPYCCPVCIGKGIVPNGFYLSPMHEWSSTSTAPEMCRTCRGKGIVWSEPSVKVIKGE